MKTDDQYIGGRSFFTFTLGKCLITVAGWVLLSHPLPAKEGLPAQSQSGSDAQEYHRRALDSFQVVGHVGEFPIYAFGKTFVHGVSPDFDLNVAVQEGNRKPQVKIKPKRSWEIVDNRIGGMPDHTPVTPRNDYQFLLASNLIDDDRQTSWISRGQARADVEPVWIRIDLARTEKVREIVLMPREDGQGIPSELTVKVSEDAWHWTTIYETKQLQVTKPGEPLRFRLTNPAPVKQVWITGNNCPNLIFMAKSSMMWPSIGSAPWANEHSFALSGVEVITEEGENVALISRGAGVTVSSTNFGHNSTWEMYEMLWPIHYDLGVKWLRTNMWGGPLQWSFVEQEKGKYVIDRRADEAVTEGVKNGCKWLMNLSYGNWLYANPPRKNFASNIWVEPYDWAPDPITPEMKEGFKNYVRFMARHFKGRIACWELYNEPFYSLQGQGKNQEMIRLYIELFKEVAPIIREEDPEAMISLAGGASPTNEWWINEQMKHLGRDGMKYVDVFGFHMQGIAYRGFRDYPEAVKRLRRDAGALGFKGLLMVSEYWVGDPYPKDETGAPWFTEIQKAKETARVYVMNLAVGVLPFWCDTWKDGLQEGNGILRNTFSADPIPPQQPEPVYYAIRTLCTVMDQARPNELLKVDFSNQAPKFHNFNFTLPDKCLLVGVWLPDTSKDRHPGIKTDVLVKGVKAHKVVGVDTLNGFEQELECRQESEGIVIPSLLVRDYPLMIRITQD